MNSRVNTNRGLALASLLLLGLIAKPVWDGRHQWQFGQGYDGGIYMVSAKSLAAGDGYRHANIPGQPFATKYPPLYPLFLAAAWRLTPDFPRTLETASILQACLLPVYLALMLLVLRQLGLSWRRSFLVAALVFVSFTFVFLTISLFSELLFGCFLLGSIWAVERAVAENSRAWSLLGGLLAGCAYLTRNAALPLLVAVPVFLFLRKRLRLSPSFFACAIPLVAGWHIWGSMHAQAGVRAPYLDEYLHAIQGGGLITHVLEQAATLSASVADELFPGLTAFLRGIPLHHLVLAAAIAGCVRIGRRLQWPLALIFTGLYLAMIVCWWFSGLGRLVEPVWFVLLAGIAEEASHLAMLVAHSIQRPSLKPWPRWVLMALAVWVAIRNDSVTWQRVESINTEVREQCEQDRQAYAWIREHAEPGTVLLAWRDTVSYLYTGIPSSHDLFVATIPQSEAATWWKPSLSRAPGQYKTELVLLLASDLGPDAQDRLGSFRKTVEAVPGATLEYSERVAFVYRLPVE